MSRWVVKGLKVIRIDADAGTCEAFGTLVKRREVRRRGAAVCLIGEILYSVAVVDGASSTHMKQAFHPTHW